MKKNPNKSEPATPAVIKSTEAKTVILPAPGRTDAETVERGSGAPAADPSETANQGA